MLDLASIDRAYIGYGPSQLRSSAARFEEQADDPDAYPSSAESLLNEARCLRIYAELVERLGLSAIPERVEEDGGTEAWDRFYTVLNMLEDPRFHSDYVGPTPQPTDLGEHLRYVATIAGHRAQEEIRIDVTDVPPSEGRARARPVTETARWTGIAREALEALAHLAAVRDPEPVPADDGEQAERYADLLGRLGEADRVLMSHTEAFVLLRRMRGIFGEGDSHLASNLRANVDRVLAEAGEEDGPEQ